MSGKHVPPSTGVTAFNCPRCGALAKQFWHVVSSTKLRKDSIPQVWTDEQIADLDLSGQPAEQRGQILRNLKRIAVGHPLLESDSGYMEYYVRNVHLSECYNCNDIAMWLHDKLLWPTKSEAPEANADLPDDARADYDEAGLVINTSPRSSAALLRQAVQRICKHLGEDGKNIDSDIASLVKKGLDPRVQKALDVVRVIGNNAVHPGQIDLKDDRQTALKLFGLVNLIVDIMITQPKNIDVMFESLPEGAKKAIDKRDTPKQIEHRTSE